MRIFGKKLCCFALCGAVSSITRVPLCSQSVDDTLRGGYLNLVNRLATEWHVFKTGGRQTTYVFVCPSVQANVGLVRDLGMSIGIAQGERGEKRKSRRIDIKKKPKLC